MSKCWGAGGHGAPWGIRILELLLCAQQQGVVARVALELRVDGLKDDFTRVHRLGRLAMKGDPVHNGLEIASKELAEERDFVELRGHINQRN